MFLFSVQLLHAVVNRNVLLDGHSTCCASSLLCLSTLVVTILCFSVSFSNYPEVNFENTSLTFSSVVRTEVTCFCPKSDYMLYQNRD